MRRLLPSWQAARAMRVWSGPALATRWIASPPPSLIDLAARAARTVVQDSILGGRPYFAPRFVTPQPDQRPVVVVREPNPCLLAATVSAGYMEAFGESAAHVVFDPDTLLGALHRVAMPGAVVVLIQNHAFQNSMKTYRLRMKLWDLGFKVAEHVHLAAVFDATTHGGSTAAAEELTAIETYLHACSVSPADCDVEGRRIATAIDESSAGLTIVTSGGHELTYSGRLETCMLNTGAYHRGSGDDSDPHGDAAAAAPSARPIGGSYPFGEVITESRLLSDVNGTATVFAFPNRKRLLHCVSDAERFTMEVKKGVIVATTGAPEEFRAVLDLVREVEGVALLRELGLGLNAAMSKRRCVSDITAFERQRGVHVSVGKRHPLFVKRLAPGEAREPYDELRRKEGKFHIDVFLDATHVYRNHDKACIEHYDASITCK